MFRLSAVCTLTALLIVAAVSAQQRTQTDSVTISQPSQTPVMITVTGTERISVTGPARDNYVRLDPFMVNSADLHRLHVELVLEVDEEAPATLIDDNMPAVRDAVLMRIIGIPQSELLGSSGRQSLKSDLTDRINEALGEDAVTGTLITDLFVE